MENSLTVKRWVDYYVNERVPTESVKLSTPVSFHGRSKANIYNAN